MAYIRGFFGGLLCLALCACSLEKKEQKLSDGEPIRVQIPFAVDGSYSLNVIELFTLKDLTRLEGLAARFLIDPDSSSGRLRGRSPHLRYIRDSEGVIVPKDDLSLQLLTVYAHFENLRRWDKAAGGATILEYPRQVAINVQFKGQGGRLENNVLYSGNHDALLVVPYTQQSLPLMVNAGVLAHEHFHSLFQRVMIAPLGKKYPNANRPTVHNEKALAEAMGLAVSQFNDEKLDTSEKDSRELYHTILFRAINEGLADVWGWIYSGDNNFVGRSLPQEKAGRELDVEVWRFYTKENLQELVKSERSDLLSASYQYGTQLARSLRNFVKISTRERNSSSHEQRMRMAKALIASLPNLREDFASLKKDEYYTLSRVAYVISREFKDMNSQECYYLAKLMPAEDRKDTKMENQCRDIEKSENK